MNRTVLIVGVAIAIASGDTRPEVEKSPPALARAIARFVIAADEDPRCRGEQRPRRRKKVGIPRVPAIAPRAVGAVGISGGTGIFAIMIIADVDHQIRKHRRGRGGDARKRPSLAIVAGLEGFVRSLDPAPGVPDHDNALGLVRR